MGSDQYISKTLFENLSHQIFKSDSDKIYCNFVLKTFRAKTSANTDISSNVL